MNGYQIGALENSKFRPTQSLSNPNTSGNLDKSSPRQKSIDIDTVPCSPELPALKMKKAQYSPFVTQPLYVGRLQVVQGSLKILSLRKYQIYLLVLSTKWCKSYSSLRYHIIKLSLPSLGSINVWWEEFNHLWVLRCKLRKLEYKSCLENNGIMSKEGKQNQSYLRVCEGGPLTIRKSTKPA